MFFDYNYYYRTYNSAYLAGSLISETYDSDFETNRFYTSWSSTRSGTLSVSLLGESFQLPMRHQLYSTYFYPEDRGEATIPQTITGSIAIVAKEYWPYKNSAGKAVFNTTTGDQEADIS